MRCGVTVRACVGMLGLRMCGGEWGWGWCARSSASAGATIPRAGLGYTNIVGERAIGVVWMKRVELWGEML